MQGYFLFVILQVHGRELLAEFYLSKTFRSDLLLSFTLSLFTNPNLGVSLISYFVDSFFSLYLEIESVSVVKSDL